MTSLKKNITFLNHVWTQEKKYCQVRATEQDKKIKRLQNELATAAYEFKSLRRKYAICDATLKRKLEEVWENPQHHLEQDRNQQVAPPRNQDQQQTMACKMESENSVQELPEVSSAVLGIIGNMWTSFGGQGGTVTV